MTLITRLKAAWSALCGGIVTPTALVVDPDAARKKLRISAEALALASIRTDADSKKFEENRRRTFEWAKPAPGVLPKSEEPKLKLAMDDAGQWQDIFGFASGQGAWSLSSIGAAYAEGLVFMGYPYLAELTQRSEYRRPAEIIAREMTRKWIKLQATGDDAESKADRLKELEAELKRLDVQAMFRK